MRKDFQKLITQLQYEGLSDYGITLLEGFAVVLDNESKSIKSSNKSWNKLNPSDKGGYICRMNNAYIKMCYWNGTEWFDMWKTTLEGIVVEWMHIPYDELFIDENKLNIDKGVLIP